MKTKGISFSARTTIAVLLAMVVVAIVVIGIFLLDSPAQERLRRLDERRLSDLREISFAVDAYWTREGVLPSSLEELGNEERIVRELADPVTGEPYEYHAGTGSSYELCAVFSRNTTTDERGSLYKTFWLHDSGRQCFQLEARDTGRIIDR